KRLFSRPSFFITALPKSKAATSRRTPNCSSAWAQIGFRGNPSIDDGEDLSGIDGLTLSDTQLRHTASLRRRNLVLHLHRFNNQYALLSVHLGTLVQENSNHLPVHWRTQNSSSIRSFIRGISGSLPAVSSENADVPAIDGDLIQSW